MSNKLVIRTDDSIEWYTPPAIFDALGLPFDLDPCAPRLPAASWIPARRRYSLPDDGLTLPWEGRVWLNPPYGPWVADWMRRLAEHGNGVALVFARTDTGWWHEVAPAALACCFIRGRLAFLRDGTDSAANNSGGPSVLLGFGSDCALAVERCGLGMSFRNAGGFCGQASLFTPPPCEPAQGSA